MFRCFFCLYFGLWIIPCAALGQNAISQGAISGRVDDPSGAVIPTAQILVFSNSTGSRQVANTSDTGFYLFPTLETGLYKLMINKTGFKITTIQNVIVQVGQTTVVNVTLEVGSRADSVTISATDQLLHPTDPS